MIPVWYKEAILYELDVKTFQDSDGDGMGDFAGLQRRLSYLAGLGVTCLWLRPFFPSPLRDDGYDVSDYYSIDPRLGTFGDFVDFMAEAEKQGLRVIVDLVFNHSSSDHPWFQEARRDVRSKYRHYYYWSKEQPESPSSGIVFPGEQETNWTFDEVAQAWYFHRFHWHQPDLNIDHPEVRCELGRIIGFWLKLGLSGFRVDAAPFLLERPDAQEKLQSFEQPADFPSASFKLLREMRLALSWRRGDAVFLAEANVPHGVVTEFFGDDGDRMHMLFNFPLNERIFLALARQQAQPIAEDIVEIANIASAGQWVNFLRNHDELDLGGLEKSERQEVFDQFAPDENMRAYGRGIRRRLAPMLDGDPRRIEMSLALLLSLPGTPLLRHGDEIGMGENLELPGRDSVRTPMQWSDDPHGGFSSASAEQLIRPVIADGPFGFQEVNVAAQQKQPDSLLCRLERLIRVRRQCPEFGCGKSRPLDVGHGAVLAIRSETVDGAVVALHNLSDQAVAVTIELDSDAGERLTDLLGDPAAGSVVDAKLELPAYGFRWLRVVGGRWRTR
jgi:maltose alpha-D-glucosyltransferase/alpha-amylase